MADPLSDLLSGDPSRVLDAVWAVIRTRDLGVLAPLVARRDDIRRATDGLDLGGLITPNRVHLEHALARLDRVADGRCWCADYPGHLSYNPETEQSAGHVQILDTSTPGWSMTYRCRCLVCGQEFEVEQGEYHSTWWRWRPTGDPT